MDLKSILNGLYTERTKLDGVISALEKMGNKDGVNPHRRRKMSVAGRRRISEAAKKRWAAVKKQTA